MASLEYYIKEIERVSCDMSISDSVKLNLLDSLQHEKSMLLFALNSIELKQKEKTQRSFILFSNSGDLTDVMEYVTSLIRRELLVDDEFVGLAHDVVCSYIEVTTFMTQGRNDVVIADILDYMSK